MPPEKAGIIVRMPGLSIADTPQLNRKIRREAHALMQMSQGGPRSGDLAEVPDTIPDYKALPALPANIINIAAYRRK